MLPYVGLKNVVASSVGVDAQDTFAAKRALAELGLYDEPGGLTEWVDTDMFDAIGKFQRDNGLYADRTMNPSGPTALMLNAGVFERRRPAAAARPALSLSGSVGEGPSPR